MRRLFCLIVVMFAVAPRAQAQISVRLTPPVDAPVSAAFDAPQSDFGAGHRGVDYAVERGTRVRAAAGGTVAFAGSVAGMLAVTIDHGSGVETTYTALSRVFVRAGERVGEGSFVGASGNAHTAPGLHFGVKVRGTYVDPTTLLAQLDVAGAIHLAPLEWMPDELGALGEPLATPKTVGTSERDCRAPRPLLTPSRPPNDNIVVAVAGITSKTKGGVSADIYESGPELLGYRASSTYRFSYAGIDGPRLHRAYQRKDTYIDIRTAAQRLRVLLREIGRRHPGRRVDLIAHSQGGIVARTFLSQLARSGDGLPVVEHLVTYASPHLGAPGAGQVDDLRDETLTGRWLLGAATRLSDRGLPVPDPSSTAVRQLAPGSDLMTSLAREDTAYGTRVLTLAIPNDPVVPADRAFIPGKEHRVVAWRGKDSPGLSPIEPPALQAARLVGSQLGGHSAIVTSPDAHGIAYSFLADQSPTCPTGWDAAGPRIASLWSSLQSSLAGIYRGVETIAMPMALWYRG